MKLAPQLISRALHAGRFEFPIEQTQATTQAAANFELNRAALDRVWPRTTLALPESLPELEWLYARDGSLSARHIDGRWVGDVSIPRLAAERVLGKLGVVGTTGVLLAPTHAEQVRAALTRMTHRQALIVVVPTEQTAGVIAACGDFSKEIAGRRLWLACGPDWAEELRALLEGNEGLAPATTMIRVPGLNTQLMEFIQKPCDAVLARHAELQRQLVSMTVAKRQRPRNGPRRLLVVGDAFELWNDGPALLVESAAGAAARVIDRSRPDAASMLLLARATEGCDAIVTANEGRADHESMIVRDDMPWVTWATTAHIPRYVAAATADVLVLADATQADLAREKGWPDTSIRITAGPAASIEMSKRASLSIIADLRPVVLPKVVEEMSSHRLAWELAERDLRADPLAFQGAPEAFIEACGRQVGVPNGTLPIALFVDALVVPLFAVELARHLVRRNVALQIFGQGWDAVSEVAHAWRGAIGGLREFDAAVGDSRALLDVWVGNPPSRACRCGRQLVKSWGRSWAAMLGEISSLHENASGPLPTTVATGPISLDSILEWLNETPPPTGDR